MLIRFPFQIERQWREGLLTKGIFCRPFMLVLIGVKREAGRILIDIFSKSAGWDLGLAREIDTLVLGIDQLYMDGKCMSDRYDKISKVRVN